MRLCVCACVPVCGCAGECSVEPLLRVRRILTKHAPNTVFGMASSKMMVPMSGGEGVGAVPSNRC